MELATYIAVKDMEIAPCRHDAQCSARRCDANATVIARAFDTSGTPVRQYDLCSEHGLLIARREKGRADRLCFCWIDSFAQHWNCFRLDCPEGFFSTSANPRLSSLGR